MARESVFFRRLSLILLLPVVMTMAAEVVYLLIWGIVLFPAGSLAGKAIWTLTCGIAMGLVIGSMVLLWVEQRVVGHAAIIRVAALFIAVSSFCAWLCSRIDMRFGYFGGEEHTVLFILSGVVPAVFGGLLLGWLLYGRKDGTAGPSGRTAA